MPYSHRTVKQYMAFKCTVVARNLFYRIDLSKLSVQPAIGAMENFSPGALKTVGTLVSTSLLLGDKHNHLDWSY